jgi:hypothetical protein
VLGYAALHPTYGSYLIRIPKVVFEVRRLR